MVLPSAQNHSSISFQPIHTGRSMAPRRRAGPNTKTLTPVSGGSVWQSRQTMVETDFSTFFKMVRRTSCSCRVINRGLFLVAAPWTTQRDLVAAPCCNYAPAAYSCVGKAMNNRPRASAWARFKIGATTFNAGTLLRVAGKDCELRIWFIRKFRDGTTHSRNVRGACDNKFAVTSLFGQKPW